MVTLLSINFYKFYYTEYEEVEVKNIDWQKSWSEGWSPVAEFDSVELQGATISRASLNGVNFYLNFSLDYQKSLQKLTHYYKINLI
jgi:NAD-dependent DNA ligase